MDYEEFKNVIIYLLIFLTISLFLNILIQEYKYSSLQKGYIKLYDEIQEIKNINIECNVED